MCVERRERTESRDGRLVTGSGPGVWRRDGHPTRTTVRQGGRDKEGELREVSSVHKNRGDRQVLTVTRAAGNTGRTLSGVHLKTDGENHSSQEDSSSSNHQRA